MCQNANEHTQKLPKIVKYKYFYKICFAALQLNDTSKLKGMNIFNCIN